MPHIQFNGSETPSSMPLPPVGVPIDFEVASIELKASEKSGKEMLEVQHRLVDGECAGEILYNYFVEPASSKRTQINLVRFAKAVGVSVGANGLDTEALLGKRGKFSLKAEQYEGKERRRIADYILP